MYDSFIQEIICFNDSFFHSWSNHSQIVNFRCSAHVDPSHLQSFQGIINFIISRLQQFLVTHWINSLDINYQIRNVLHWKDEIDLVCVRYFSTKEQDFTSFRERYSTAHSLCSNILQNALKFVCVFENDAFEISILRRVLERETQRENLSCHVVSNGRHRLP